MVIKMKLLWCLVLLMMLELCCCCWLSVVIRTTSKSCDSAGFFSSRRSFTLCSAWRRTEVILNLPSKFYSLVFFSSSYFKTTWHPGRPFCQTTACYSKEYFLYIHKNNSYSFYLHQRERHAHGINTIAVIRSRFKHCAKRHRDNHRMIGIFLKGAYSISSFTWAIF